MDFLELQNSNIFIGTRQFPSYPVLNVFHFPIYSPNVCIHLIEGLSIILMRFLVRTCVFEINVNCWQQVPVVTTWTSVISAPAQTWTLLNRMEAMNGNSSKNYISHVSLTHPYRANKAPATVNLVIWMYVCGSC